MISLTPNECAGVNDLSRMGLLADSHGRAEITARAASLLIQNGAQYLIHLGDIGDESVLEALVDAADRGGLAKRNVHVVFGNVDDRPADLRRFAQSLGITVDHPVGRLWLGGRSMIFLHGHDARRMSDAMSNGADYLCHGHTHRQRDQRVNKMRVINPGALFRGSCYSVALLDLQADSLEFFEIQ